MSSPALGLLFVNHQLYREICEHMDNNTIHAITIPIQEINQIAIHLRCFPMLRIRRLQIHVTNDRFDGYKNVEDALDVITNLVRSMALLVEIHIIWSQDCEKKGGPIDEELYNCKNKVLHDLSRLLKTSGLADLKKYRIIPDLRFSDVTNFGTNTWIFEKRPSGSWMPSNNWNWE